MGIFKRYYTNWVFPKNVSVCLYDCLEDSLQHSCFGISIALFLADYEIKDIDSFISKVKEIQCFHIADHPDVFTNDGTDFLSTTHQTELGILIEPCSRSVLSSKLNERGALNFLMALVLELNEITLYHVILLRVLDKTISFISTVGDQLLEIYAEIDRSNIDVDDLVIPPYFLGESVCKGSGWYQLKQTGSEF